MKSSAPGTVYRSYSRFSLQHGITAGSTWKEGPLRFQMLERLPEGDPEAVLRAMEESLREISSELSREGHRITLTGLGPSPRIKNRRDRAVIDVTVEDSATLIQVDATYQASAFLGDMPQNAVVEAKLRRVFDEVRARMGLKAVPPPDITSPTAHEPSATAMRFSAAMNGNGATGAETVLEPPFQVAPQVIESKSAETMISEAPSLPAAERAPAIPALATGITAAEPLTNSSMVSVEKTVTAVLDVPSEIAVEAAAPSVLKTEAIDSQLKVAPVLSPVVKNETVSTTPVTKPSTPDAIEKEEPKASVSAASLPELKNSDEDAPKNSLRWGAWAAAIIVLVLAPAAWLYLPQEFGRSTPAQETTPAPARLTPVQSLPEQSKPQPGTEDDPQAVIKDWETALRSTDAALQSSFYADPVDRYFLRHGVKKEEVLADKQASIAKREGDWSVTLEQIKVRQQPDGSTASVRLIKHYTIRQNGHLSSQWYVPSQLLLKRADRRWQITSERDLGWSNTMDEIDY